MRFVQVMVPAGKRQAVVDCLEDAEVDYVVTEEISGREYAAVVSFPLPTNAVEPILQQLREAGIDEEAYTVVLDAKTVVSRRFERLVERYEEENKETSGDRIAREELHAQAVELAPDLVPYLVMTVISAVVATAGVLLDSPAIVVGSMVIAPLVGPAMTTSIGSVVDDSDLFRRGIRLQIVGILLATVAAAAFAVAVRSLGLVPSNLDLATVSQFRGRLTPDFLSLAVALGAGVAGAVSVASGVSIALVGVMIAAALVPPIAVVGIGVAWGLPMTVLSSGVLVLVNVLSINLAALTVLWYMGYRPDRWFRHGAARRATIKRVGVLIFAIAVLSTFLAGVTYTTSQTSTFEQDARAVADGTLGDPPNVGPGRYADLELLEFNVQYASSVPFRKVDRVVVVVGRPDGVRTPGLAEILERRINEEVSLPLGFARDDQHVEVQVRYMEVDTGSEGASTRSIGRPNPAESSFDASVEPSPTVLSRSSAASESTVPVTA